MVMTIARLSAAAVRRRQVSLLAVAFATVALLLPLTEAGVASGAAPVSEASTSAGEV